MCSGCKLVRYCSTGCQKADWKSGHKLVCRMGGVDEQALVVDEVAALPGFVTWL